MDDVASELPLHEKALSANHDEKTRAVPILQDARESLLIPTEGVSRDANYVTQEILAFIFLR